MIHANRARGRRALRHAAMLGLVMIGNGARAEAPPATPVPPAVIIPLPAPGPAPNDASFPPANGFPGTPAPGASPSSPMPAPPPSAVQLIAPLAGQWQGTGSEAGAATRHWLTLNRDGTFVAYTEYAAGQGGLVMQTWGRYSVFAIQPETGFLTVDIQGYQPQQTCSAIGCQPVQMTPQANMRFTLAGPNTLRTQLGAAQASLTRLPTEAAPQRK